MIVGVNNFLDITNTKAEKIKIGKLNYNKI